MQSTSSAPHKTMRRLAACLALLLLTGAALADGSLGQILEADQIEGLQPREGDLEQLIEAQREELAGRIAQTRGASKLQATDTFGGDDVVVMQSDDIADFNAIDMAIASDGKIFVVVELAFPNGRNGLEVWRSVDGGSQWALWGTLAPGLDYSRWTPSIVIGEGQSDRVFVAFSEKHTGQPSMIRVASSSLNLNNAIWLTHTVMSTPNSMYRPDLATDSGNFYDYRVYLVAHEDDGQADIWFAQTDDQGQTWEAAYEMATLNVAGLDYMQPQVSYGFGGRVHVAWRLATFGSELYDDALRYSHALNRASNGLGDWQGIKSLSPTGDGIDDRSLSIVGNRNNGEVLISSTTVPVGGGVYLTPSRLSLDGGSTWDAANDANLYPNSEQRLISLPNNGGYCSAGFRYWEYSWGIVKTPTGGPSNWSQPEIYADESYPQHHFVDSPGVAFDPTHNNRLGFAWVVKNNDPAIPDMLYFDAEWRNDPGYPNLEDNFPMPLAAVPSNPPALADVDGDARSLEIVFTTSDNMLHVVDRFAQELPGFPVLLDYDASHESLAVGDFEGDGTLEIVVGTDRGVLFCYEHDGSMRGGWPVDLGTNAPAYVSLGTVSKLTKLDVVATSANELHLLQPDGLEHDYAPYPIVVPETLNTAASLGDIDLDGKVEIVIVGGDKVRAFRNDGSSLFLRTMAGLQLNSSPAIGNLDPSDPELEIVVPSNLGEVWAFEHYGANLAGWPLVIDNDWFPIVEPSIADLGSGVPSVVLQRVDGRLYVVDKNGIVQPGFPVEIHPSMWATQGAVIDEFAPGTGDILTTDTSSHANAFDAGGNVKPGFPKPLAVDLGGNWAFAATGDLDGDNETEIVMLSEIALQVFDTNTIQTLDQDRRWPMFGNDPERSHCTGCQVDQVTAVDDFPTQTRVQFAAPFPNPAPGRTTLSFALPMRAAVQLEIIDVRGRRLRTVARSELDAGVHQIAWDARDDASQRVARGHYFARLSVQGPGISEVLTQRILLID